MKTIPIKIVGPSNQDRSSQLSAQYTQNVYLAPSKTKEGEFASYDWPGLKAHYAGAGADRGMIAFRNEKYKVSGTNLVSIDSNGSITTRGTVPGRGRCIFAICWDDTLEDYGLLIATDGARYYYDLATVTLISDADLNTGYSVAVMNDVAIFDNEDGDMVHSINGSPTNVQSFYATTNTNPDGLQRVYTYGQILYAFGYSSIELWVYNGATTSFIFTRQEQATIPIGTAARYSLSSDESFVYFLGSDRRFYRMRQSQIEPISDEGINDQVEKMAEISDAIGFCLKISGQSFYVVSFPTENKTFYFSATNGYWGNLAYGTDSDNPARHLAISYAFINNKHYVADYRNGNVYEWDMNTYTDNGEARLRIRVMAPLTGSAVGVFGRSITCSCLHIDLESGVGLETGQGSAPVLMCTVSGDSGKSWSAESFVDIGVLGAYTEKPKYDQFVSGRSIVYRIMCSDPIYLSIFGGAVDVTDGGY
jgi:hypothetical protein